MHAAPKIYVDNAAVQAVEDAKNILMLLYWNDRASHMKQLGRADYGRRN